MNENQSPTQPSPSDHDTLVRIETKLELLTLEVKSGNDDAKERLVSLSENKMEKEAFHQWEIAHEKETTLREEAFKKTLHDHSIMLQELHISDDKQNTKLTYIGGGLFVFGIILSIIGPLITQAIAHVLHLK